MIQELDLEAFRGPLYCCQVHRHLQINQLQYSPVVALEDSRCVSRYLYGSERQCLSQSYKDALNTVCRLGSFLQEYAPPDVP